MREKNEWKKNGCEQKEETKAIRSRGMWALGVRVKHCLKEERVFFVNPQNSTDLVIAGAERSLFNRSQISFFSVSAH